MSTLNAFLKIDGEKTGDISYQQKYFNDTNIFKDKVFCSKFMGQQPVFFITLKDVDGNFFEEAYRNFAQIVSGVASDYKYLFNSINLDELDKDKLSKTIDVSFLRLLNKLIKNFSKCSL